MEWGNHPWNCGANALEMIHNLQIDLTTNDDSDGGKFVHTACVCGFVIVLSPTHQTVSRLNRFTTCFEPVQNRVVVC